jgi:hypothetical protein
MMLFRLPELERTACFKFPAFSFADLSIRLFVKMFVTTILAALPLDA